MKVFETFRRELTSDKVHDAIRTAILSGRLKTGQRIQEIVLSKEFGVSRAVVREALQQLAHEGLVEQNSYKGTRVVRLTVEQIDEIIGVRLLLETEAFRSAAARITQADAKLLQSLTHRLEAARRNPKQFVEYDLALHDKVWEIAGNETVRKLLHQIITPVFAMSVIMRTQATTVPLPQENWNLGDHVRLIEPVCAGHPHLAAEEIRFHITENWKVTRERLRLFLEAEGHAARSEEPAQV